MPNLFGGALSVFAWVGVAIFWVGHTGVSNPCDPILRVPSLYDVIQEIKYNRLLHRHGLLPQLLGVPPELLAWQHDRVSKGEAVLPWANDDERMTLETL